MQITGIDLVEWQLRVAANEPLPASQAGDRPDGPRHRVPHQRRGPRPTASGPRPALVTRELEFPSGEGIRVDTHLRSGDRIPPNYDSMVAKLIVQGADRDQAIERSGSPFRPRASTA